MPLEVAVDRTDGWPEPGWEALAERAAMAALRGAGRGDLAQAFGEISLRLTDDAEVQQLNAAYRGKDKPTNILSFPQFEADKLDAGMSHAGELLLGDMIVARETVVGEAAEKCIALESHVTHLIVHGTLHLIGYDHQDDGSADAMEALEREVLAGLGIADPYAPIDDDGEE